MSSRPVIHPQQKVGFFKGNFLEYYAEYVDKNKTDGNRALQNSFKQFKEFVGRSLVSPVDITENLCKEFRKFLLAKFKGEHPQENYERFKWVLNAATKDKYFQVNSTDEVAAIPNPSATLKDDRTYSAKIIGHQSTSLHFRV